MSNINSHDFYNLLENRRELAKFKNGVWEYPQDFLDRYNAHVSDLESEPTHVKAMLATMTTLEAEQNKYTGMNARSA